MCVGKSRGGLGAGGRGPGVGANSPAAGDSLTGSPSRLTSGLICLQPPGALKSCPQTRLLFHSFRQRHAKGGEPVTCAA